MLILSREWFPPNQTPPASVCEAPNYGEPGITEPFNILLTRLVWCRSNPLFMNDAADYQDIYSSYGTENHARLKEIAKKYDPHGFMLRQGGWPL